MLTIRPYNYDNADYLFQERLKRENWPLWAGSAEMLQVNDEKLDPKTYNHHIIAELDGEPVGFGNYSEAFWNQARGQYFIRAVVLPQFQRQGIGRRLYDFMLAKVTSERDVKRILCYSREDKLDAVGMLKRRGYKLVGRFPRSELVVDGFDSAEYQPLIDKLQADGIAIRPLAEIIPSDPNWQRKLYELNWILEQDEPQPTPPKKKSFEEYVSRKLEKPDVNFNMWFMALDTQNDNRFAGLTQLWPHSARADYLAQGWTGVDRPYRRKGIARALKAVGIAYARSVGIKHILTDNEETNPMYQLNLQLGFKPMAAWVDYELTLSD